MDWPNEGRLCMHWTGIEPGEETVWSAAELSEIRAVCFSDKAFELRSEGTSFPLSSRISGSHLK
jgi:hypothetical protein